MASTGAQAAKLLADKPSVINTEYFDVTITPYKLSENLRGSGRRLGG